MILNIDKQFCFYLSKYDVNYKNIYYIKWLKTTSWIIKYNSNIKKNKVLLKNNNILLLNKKLSSLNSWKIYIKILIYLKIKMVIILGNESMTNGDFQNFFI